MPFPDSPPPNKKSTKLAAVLAGWLKSNRWIWVEELHDLWNAKLLTRNDAKRISTDLLGEFAGQTCWETGCVNQVCKGWLTCDTAKAPPALQRKTAPQAASATSDSSSQSRCEFENACFFSGAMAIHPCYAFVFDERLLNLHLAPCSKKIAVF